MRLADAGKKQTQEGVDLGGGADRGSTVSAKTTLIDNDRCRQVLKPVRVRLAMMRKPVAHEARIGFGQLALGFSGDGVEQKRRLPRAGDSGENHDPPLGDLDGQIPEIVRAGAQDA
ncbi:hypothetical protein LZ189_02915, partial [Rhodovulum sulfidophilum]|nr:hypothetical protein [Rhodovulum sulfidophilum]